MGGGPDATATVTTDDKGAPTPEHADKHQEQASAEAPVQQQTTTTIDGAAESVNGEHISPDTAELITVHASAVNSAATGDVPGPVVPAVHHAQQEDHRLKEGETYSKTARVPELVRQPSESLSLQLADAEIPGVI